MPDPVVPVADPDQGTRCQPAAGHQARASGEGPKLGQDGVPRDVLLDPFHAAWSSLRASPAEPDGVLGDLLCWAERNNVAGADDLRMLVRLHEGAGYGSGGRHRVAAEFGINERTLRRRRDRTLTALRAAGPRFLQQCAA